MESSVIEFIKSILVVSGIGVILAFLLEIAYTFLGDYGERHIVINEEKDLVVNGGRSLLASLMEEKIYIPSACGGKGTCSYCKVRVLDGGGPVLPTETPYLSDEELHADVRLSCQVKVKEDLEIEIPEELFRIKEFKSRVSRIKELTPDIKELSLDILLPDEGITFKPGQYVQLEVPKYKGTKGPEYRAYSVASGADKPHSLVLAITKVPKGAVSTYVHNYLQEGDHLILRGPYGDFFLRESDRDILLISTGSGLAPMMSILRQIKSENIKRNATLFFGCRAMCDLYYINEIKDLEREIDNFTFIPTLSQPGEQELWKGETGRVTNLIEKHINKNSDIDAYLCGSPKMVDSCEELLLKKGVPEKNIYFDKFE
ncbi:NADH:ubiquinone reductase (Na(+)-transporting) subunit F [Thermodesulfobacteriota bacterium]